ncbi:MAG: hypothetical protein M3Y07_07970 [Acidobacteriota bacterium]|nr:hypothetical protein [Acidobacteriota bacterium]
MAVLVPLSLLLLSNSRITEAKETLRADMRTLNAELRGEISTLRAETNERFTRVEARFDRLEGKIDAVLTLLAHIDGRVTHLEERR